MPVGSTELRPHRLKVGLYDITGDKLSRRKNVELDVAGALTEVTELAGEKTADLVLINDGDQSYAKLRFDDRSIATMKSHLGKLDDSLSRGLIWASLWDSTRDGELAASDYVTIALNALAGETDIATVTITVMQIDTAQMLTARNCANKQLTHLRNSLITLLPVAIINCNMPNHLLTLPTPQRNLRRSRRSLAALSTVLPLMPICVGLYLSAA
jgi:hypothetical protein